MQAEMTVGCDDDDFQENLFSESHYYSFQEYFEII